MNTIHKRIIDATIFTILILATFAFSRQLVDVPANSAKKPLADTMNINEPSIESLKSPHKQLSGQIFQMAAFGYRQLASANKISKPLLTIIDFSKPSTEKRLFIIDMEQNKVLVHSLVAHGSNSGGNMANRFSNINESHQSSLGFYLTGSTYQGGNGYSMKLKGLEPGFNHNAERRAIVMHGAPYVSENAIQSLGRLGRSWGCPAVSQKEHKMIIDLIKEGSCLFIYAPNSQYLSSSNMLSGFNLSQNLL